MAQCRWCYENIILTNKNEDPSYKSQYQSFKHGDSEMHMSAKELDEKYDEGEHPLRDWIISLHDKDLIG